MVVMRFGHFSVHMHTGKFFNYSLQHILQWPCDAETTLNHYLFHYIRKWPLWERVLLILLFWSLFYRIGRTGFFTSTNGMALTIWHMHKDYGHDGIFTCDALTFRNQPDGEAAMAMDFLSVWQKFNGSEVGWRSVRLVD